MPSADLNLALLVPELTLGVLAILVIAVDLVLPKGRKDLLAYLTALGLGLAGILVVARTGEVATGFAETWTVDAMSAFFKLIFLIAAGLVALSAVDYVRRRSAYPGEFYATLLVSTLGMMLMAGATELITLYVALELTSISLYILAGFLKTESSSTEAGLKYLLLGAVSSATLLYGMALTFGLTGTTVLSEIAARVTTTGASPLLILSVVFMAAGFGFKVGAVPFHMWVPDVYHGAPVPVTSFLAVASKASGFVVLLRVFGTAFEPLSATWTVLFGIVAAVTMTVGNLGALRQTNLRRLMGYSSVGQAGYALMALAVWREETAAALLFFLGAYLLTNLTVFAAITHLSNQLGGDDLADYAGLSRRAPAMSLALLVGLLSLVGMPLLVGFWSKVYLFLAVFEAGAQWLVVIGLLNTALSAYYYLKVAHAMYFLPASVDQPLGGDRSLFAALVTSVTGIIVLGLAPSPLIEVAMQAAMGLLATG